MQCPAPASASTERPAGASAPDRGERVGPRGSRRRQCDGGRVRLSTNFQVFEDRPGWLIGGVGMSSGRLDPAEAQQECVQKEVELLSVGAGGRRDARQPASGTHCCGCPRASGQVSATLDCRRSSIGGRGVMRSRIPATAPSSPPDLPCGSPCRPDAATVRGRPKVRAWKPGGLSPTRSNVIPRGEA